MGASLGAPWGRLGSWGLLEVCLCLFGRLGGVSGRLGGVRLRHAPLAADVGPMLAVPKDARGAVEGQFWPRQRLGLEHAHGNPGTQATGLRAPAEAPAEASCEARGSGFRILALAAGCLWCGCLVLEMPAWLPLVAGHFCWLIVFLS